MGLFSRFRKQPEVTVRKYATNPHLHQHRVREAGFYNSDVGRLLSGWDTSSSTIDYYLQSELRGLRARSRKMVRSNPYAKRFVAMIKSNVVGPNGVVVQSQVMRSSGILDTPANDAIERAFSDWSANHCDYHGRLTLVEMENLAISCAGQDGEFLFRIHRNPRSKYGLQLECIDPELLDVDKNEITKTGNTIRLGVEYDRTGKRVRYHFRELKDPNVGYSSGRTYSVDANFILHGFLPEWPDQSRGVPWMHSALERNKHLEKYEEAAIIKARSTASTMAVLRSPAGDPAYAGDVEGDEEGVTLDQYEAGTIKDIGDKEIINLDSDYPHEMYASFVKSQLQGIASGLGISYHSLSNDLEGVNYSSIRAGVLEDREVFKGLQNWFIRAFVRPVYEEWIQLAYTKNAIKIGTTALTRPIDDYLAAKYQPRRWAWVDPQKDGAANQLALDYKLKSHSQIMREQGDDPETVWREIQRDKQIMEQLGIAPQLTPENATDDESDPTN